MPDNRRACVPGATCFFTVDLRDRQMQHDGAGLEVRVAGPGSDARRVRRTRWCDSGAHNVQVWTHVDRNLRLIARARGLVWERSMRIQAYE
jgi:hypothetical protein